MSKSKNNQTRRDTMSKQTLTVACVALGLGLLAGACGGTGEDMLGSPNGLLVNPDKSLELNQNDRRLAGPDAILDADKSLENNRKVEVASGAYAVADDSHIPAPAPNGMVVADDSQIPAPNGSAESVVDLDKSLEENQQDRQPVGPDPVVDPEKSLEDNQRDRKPAGPDPILDAEKSLEEQQGQQTFEPAEPQLDDEVACGPYSRRCDD
jgi:hypothetical protein